MKAFYGSKISENMTKTPEGFLICCNVPIARTGWYDYLAQEMGLEGQGIVKVYRSPEEVFSRKAIASFEGKIVTNNHPPDLLTPENSELYTKGAIQNVRQSTDEPDLLIADLIIYNKTLIDEIQQGKRDVSCGYEYNCVDNGNGTYSQINIVGNHVAVVESGRAGDRVAIMDSKIKQTEGEKKIMSKVKIPRQQRGPVTNFMAALGLKHFAQDAEPQEIAEAVDALAEERENTPAEKSEGKDAEVESPTEQQKEDAEMNALSAKVDQCMELCQKCMEMMKGSQESKPEDAIDEMINNLSKGENSTGDEEESVTVPVEEMDEDINENEEPMKSADSAAMIRALNAIKPMLAAIPDPKARKKACDSVIAEFSKAKKSTSKGNGYKQILEVQKNNSASKAQKAADAKEKTYQDIENSYAKSNPHNKKEMK